VIVPGSRNRSPPAETSKTFPESIWRIGILERTGPTSCTHRSLVQPALIARSGGHHNRGCPRPRPARRGNRAWRVGCGVGDGALLPVGAPPSRVLSTVPSVPLAQATLPSTESMPRRLAVEPESCHLPDFVRSGTAFSPAGVSDWAAATLAAINAAMKARQNYANHGHGLKYRAGAGLAGGSAVGTVGSHGRGPGSQASFTSPLRAKRLLRQAIPAFRCAACWAILNTLLRSGGLGRWENRRGDASHVGAGAERI